MKTYETTAELIEILKGAKGGRLTLGNDSWILNKGERPPGEIMKDGPHGRDFISFEAEDEWSTGQVICRGDFSPDCDLIEALAKMAGLRTEGA